MSCNRYYLNRKQSLLLKIYEYEVCGTEPSFLLLVRCADPADRRCDRRTDRQTQTDRHNKGALGHLVLKN